MATVRPIEQAIQKVILEHVSWVTYERLLMERTHSSGAGSTTLRRRDAQGGSEPDACFYFEHAARIRVQDEVDLDVDPPPELIIEIDITSPSLNKLPIYASLGVPEIWRHDGTEVVILFRVEDQYVSQAASTVLPSIDATTLNV